MQRVFLTRVVGTISVMISSAVGLDASMADDGSTSLLRGGYAHVGALLSHQADEGTLTVGGTPVPGADYETKLTGGLSLELGYFLRGGFAVSISGTTPMTTPNTAAGTIAGYGELGAETIGYYAVTGHMHIPVVDGVAPYFGGGLGYMHVFRTSDGAITDLEISSAMGPVLQAGIDLAFAENIGAFVDFKQFLISTTATGVLGAAVEANTTVNPWILSSGIGFHF